MTQIPKWARGRIAVPSGGEHDVAMAALDAELHEDALKEFGGDLPSISRLGGILRRAALRLPEEVTPGKLTTIGLAFGVMSTNPQTSKPSRLTNLALAASSISLAIERKDIEETEERYGVLRGVPDSPEDPRASSILYRISLGLAGIGAVGDSLGLDNKRRAIALAGSTVAAVSAAYMSHMEAIGEAAPEVAGMGGE